MSKKNFEEITNHLKTSGFVFQGSQIYGGLANTWDFGPLGVALKRNIKNKWWKEFIDSQPLNVGMDAAILMNPAVWQASGHLDTFSDPLMDCRQCKTRHRADKLIEESMDGVDAGSMTIPAMEAYIKEHHIACPNCGSHDFTSIRHFNLMFKTFQGVTEDSTNIVYLRPETAQGIFVNFKNVMRSMRLKLPFGIGQIGKSFRNEITPGNMIFRTREFEQMELEFFCKPGEDLKWYQYWLDKSWAFCVDLGIDPSHLQIRDHSAEELSHYSVATADIEYQFPWGFDEIWGVADRTDYDLKQHQIHAKESFEVLDLETNEKYIPYCVEPSVGVERLMLMVLTEAYDVEPLANDDSRIVMRFTPELAPIKAAVLPLSKKLSTNAQELYEKLAQRFEVTFDETASIGKRYRRQDAIGTPFCITFDFDTLDDNQVTVRERDSMAQERVAIDDLEKYLQSRLQG